MTEFQSASATNAFFNRQTIFVISSTMMRALLGLHDVCAVNRIGIDEHSRSRSSSNSPGRRGWSVPCSFGKKSRLVLPAGRKSRRSQIGSTAKLAKEEWRIHIVGENRGKIGTYPNLSGRPASESPRGATESSHAWPMNSFAPPGLKCRGSWFRGFAANNAASPTAKSSPALAGLARILRRFFTRRNKSVA